MKSKYLNISKQLPTANGLVTAVVLAHRLCLTNIALHWFNGRTFYRLALCRHGVLVTHAL